MSTIKDVSREAGVSIATVSRVINNTKTVNQETRERVMAAIDHLKYQTNVVAKSLRSNKSYRVAVIITSLARTFFSQIVEGIEEVASANGYHIIISVTNDDVDTEREQVEYFAAQRVDGIILVSSVDDDRKQQEYISLIEGLKKKDVPVPVVTLEFALQSNRIDAVTINHERVGYDATSYLIQSNSCKNILHISHKKGNRIGTMRMQGYKRALKAAGLPVREDYILYGDYSIRGGYNLMNDFLKKKLPLDGVYCANDQTAIGVIRACREWGLSIPEDVAVSGTDDIYASALTSPSLTTISIPKHEMGTQAMELLLERIEEGGEYLSTNIILDHKLIERESTKKDARVSFPESGE